jgi:hypothetical protein
MKTIKSAIVLAFAATLVAAASTAIAGGWGWDRDAGAKARGDFGPTRSSDRYEGYTYRPRAAREFAASSPFGCEPVVQTTLHKGDKAIVNVEAGKLMIGDETVATISRGQRLTVLKVEGPWVGASIRVGGQDKKGWIRGSELIGLANQTETRLCAVCRR